MRFFITSATTFFDDLPFSSAKRQFLKQPFVSQRYNIADEHIGSLNNFHIKITRGFVSTWSFSVHERVRRSLLLDGDSRSNFDHRKTVRPVSCLDFFFFRPPGST